MEFAEYAPAKTDQGKLDFREFPSGGEVSFLAKGDTRVSGSEHDSRGMQGADLPRLARASQPLERPVQPHRSAK